MADLLELSQKKIKYRQINEYQKLFNLAGLKEMKLLEELKTINTSVSSGITDDANKISRKSHIERELNSIIKSKESILKDINKVKGEFQEMCLIIDDVLFDNLNYMIEISKNFQVLEALYKGSL